MSKKANPTDFVDFSKVLGDFKIPGVDWQELMASQHKNIAALSKANQLLFEGAHAVVQRQVEILQKAIVELGEASKAMLAEGDPQANAHKRFELAKVSFEAAINNMRELAELAGKSNREALEVINQRALESFEEVKAAIQARR